MVKSYQLEQYQIYINSQIVEAVRPRDEAAPLIFLKISAATGGVWKSPCQFVINKPIVDIWHIFCCYYQSWGLTSTQMHRQQIIDYREVDLSVSRLVGGF